MLVVSFYIFITLSVAGKAPGWRLIYSYTEDYNVVFSSNLDVRIRTEDELESDRINFKLLTEKQSQAWVTGSILFSIIVYVYSYTI